MGIIPGSMGTRSYIVRGKGNPDSFSSCSHGAGRAMSRNEAKRRFTVEDHMRMTDGVECRKDADVIDETPAAYKSIDAVMENDGWVVASQSAWKGWRAYIDGHRVQTRFANHAFLGVFVSKGRHVVKLQYLPESFTRGRNISFTTLGALIAAAIFPSARRRFQKPRAVRV